MGENARNHEDWCATVRNPRQADAPVLCNCPYQIVAFEVLAALNSDKAERVLATAVSDALSAMTEGTEYAEAPEPSDEPGSPYVMGLARELLAALREGLAE